MILPGTASAFGLESGKKLIDTTTETLVKVTETTKSETSNLIENTTETVTNEVDKVISEPLTNPIDVDIKPSKNGGEVNTNISLTDSIEIDTSLQTDTQFDPTTSKSGGNISVKLGDETVSTDVEVGLSTDLKDPVDVDASVEVGDNSLDISDDMLLPGKSDPDDKDQPSEGTDGDNTEGDNQQPGGDGDTNQEESSEDNEEGRGDGDAGNTGDTDQPDERDSEEEYDNTDDNGAESSEDGDKSYEEDASIIGGSSSNGNGGQNDSESVQKVETSVASSTANASSNDAASGNTPGESKENAGNEGFWDKAIPDTGSIVDVWLFVATGIMLIAGGMYLYRKHKELNQFSF